MSEFQLALARVARPSALREIEARLVRHGASERLAAAICDRVQQRLGRGEHAVDLAAEALGAVFPMARLARRERGPRGLALVGPHAAGTSALARKLAALFSGAGRSTASIVLGDTSVLARGAFAKREIVVVDAGGGAAGVESELERLQTRAPELDGAIDVHLVLRADAMEGEMRAAFEDLASLLPRAVSLTHLDRATRPGRALEIAREHDLPVAFFASLERAARATPERIADLFLRGRFS